MEMGTLELVGAICLILSCIFIIIMVLMQDSKKGMSQALAGGNTDNFYQKNQGRSKEARLAKATRTAAILFFVVTLIVNVFAIFQDKPEDDLSGLLDGLGLSDDADVDGEGSEPDTDDSEAAPADDGEDAGAPADDDEDADAPADDGEDAPADDSEAPEEPEDGE